MGYSYAVAGKCITASTTLVTPGATDTILTVLFWLLHHYYMYLYLIITLNSYSGNIPQDFYALF